MLNKKLLVKDLVDIRENSTGSIYNKAEVEEILIIRHHFSSAEAVTRMGPAEYNTFLVDIVTGGTGTEDMERSFVHSREESTSTAPSSRPTA